MSKLGKVALIWGGFVIGFYLLYFTSPMDGSATRQDGKAFGFMFIGAIVGTVLVIRNKE
jgi:hypothetical protein